MYDALIKYKKKKDSKIVTASHETFPEAWDNYIEKVTLGYHSVEMIDNTISPRAVMCIHTVFHYYQ